MLKFSRSVFRSPAPRAWGAAVAVVFAANLACGELPEFAPIGVMQRRYPAIKNAPVVSADEADRSLSEKELVLGVVIEGKARAYPINMLATPRREIANDTLADRAIVATWCELCHNGIVFAARVKDKDLTFVKSGMQWQRNVVMMDLETHSLWSQLLGRAMDGPLKDAELEVLPSVVTDWKTWRDEHPDTTVLNLFRTSRSYQSDFYRDLSQFVLGMATGDRARAWPLDQLAQKPVVNGQFDGEPVLVVYLKESATAIAYDRRNDGHTLTFALHDGKLRDDETGSEWDAACGEAVKGPLAGAQLTLRRGKISSLRAWRDFYPDSAYWKAS